VGYNNISFIKIVESKGEDINSYEQKRKGNMVETKVVVATGDGPKFRYDNPER
jgi:hypothetical protein